MNEIIKDKMIDKNEEGVKGYFKFFDVAVDLAVSYKTLSLKHRLFEAGKHNTSDKELADALLSALSGLVVLAEDVPYYGQVRYNYEYLRDRLASFADHRYMCWDDLGERYFDTDEEARMIQVFKDYTREVSKSYCV